jgi:hypothetical protein
MERLTSLTYNDPLLQPGITHNDPANPLPGDFERKWTVTADDPIPGCKTIAMEVRWTEGSAEKVTAAKTAIASVGR